MASCAVAEAVRDAHLRGEGDVYAVNAECADGTYADYYFDGNEEIKLLYKCPGPTDCDTFARSYRHVADHVLNTTKCKDMKDARLDCIVLARMLASAVVSVAQLQIGTCMALMVNTFLGLQVGLIVGILCMALISLKT
uniref:hypothetical protein n=1 Tax=Anaplasma marginale TaxID=770 RepID=UPI00040D76E5|nr:hypothetical protein [Anaplasma marginale]